MFFQLRSSLQENLAEQQEERRKTKERELAEQRALEEAQQEVVEPEAVGVVAVVAVVSTIGLQCGTPSHKPECGEVQKISREKGYIIGVSHC